MSEVSEERSSPEKLPKFERPKDDCFLEIVTDGKDKSRRAAYFRRDINVRVPLHNLRITAGSVSSKAAKEAAQYSSRLRAERGAREGDISADEPSFIPEPTHISIVGDAEITNTDHVAFGLISEGGPTDYKGRVAIEIRLGPEKHSHISHYAASSGSSEVIYITVYLSGERLEWLRQERTARPNIVPIMTATVVGFKQHGEWNFNRHVKIYVEPEQSTEIKDVSFYVGEATDELQPAEPTNGAIAAEYRRWLAALKKQIVDDAGDKKWKRCAGTFDHVGYNVAKWCVKNNKSPADTAEYLRRAEQFLQRLDDVIHDKSYGLKVGYGVWQHVHNFKTFVQSSKPSGRQEFAEDSRLNELLEEYLNRPSLQDDHLDWLLLDLFLAAQCVAVYESYMKLKHGISYSLFDGSGWRMFLWKLVMRPLGLVTGWILPGVGFYYLARWSPWVGIGLAVVYYGFSVWGAMYWLWNMVGDLLGASRSPKKKLLGRIDQFDKVYPLLAPATIHLPTVRRAFDLAQDSGANFDQRLSFILDQVAQRSPQRWRTSSRGSYFHLLDLSDDL